MLVTVLGPLKVVAGDGKEPVPMSAARLRVLLAVLLWQVNQPVAVDELAELVWDGAPPDGVAAAVRALVMRLRRVLGEQAGARVVTRAPGYLIELSGDELDASRFEALCGNAGAAARAGRWAEAGEAAAAALGLWRGVPLADVPSQLLRDQWVPRLEQARMQVLEWRIEADLHEGRHEQLIGELRDVVARHPLRERFHAQLMLALARAGRQAEALTAYKQARATLVSELGVEPGPELRRVHERILAGDEALVTPPPPASGASVVVPRELPGAVRHFTGREAELTALTALTEQATDRLPGTVVISAIGGSAGVGKTALAVHWAHRAADRFPDGQLYVNLRGYDPGEPMPATEALAGFLQALGVPGNDIPAEADQRAARYRSLLAGRRVLVVLDNAGSPEQVRPLLPGTPGCVTLVTSRDSLPGLVARDGAARLDLDALPPADALCLLRGLIGGRVAAEPDGATALAEQCCRLPLALRVVAELAIARPATSLAELAGELADQQGRLDLLEAGADPRTAMRSVFSWSCQRLDADSARAFRLLGLHPGPDLDRYAAAALAGTSLGEGERLLGLLARAYLIQPTTPGRYIMHDLLRGYARELAAAGGHGEEQAALTRLLDLYLSAAAAAMDTLYPAERLHRPDIPASGAPVPAFAGETAARAWLEGERANLVAVTSYAARTGWPGHATRLSGTLFRYLDVGGHFPEAVIIHGHARYAAQQSGDPGPEATALLGLGIVDYRLDRYQHAARYLRQALALFREADDQAGEARSLSNLGMIDYQGGRYQQADDHYREALALFREIGDATGEARIRAHLALIDHRRGQYQQAAAHLEHALALCLQTGDLLIEAYASAILGEVELRQGRYRQATGHLQRAMAACRETGYWSVQADALGMLGLIDGRQGRHQQAAVGITKALALYRQNGDRKGEGAELSNLGLVELWQGRYQQAAGDFRQSLALFREIGDLSGEAEARNGLGEVLAAAGKPGLARKQHAAALRVASEADVPYEQARARHGLGRAHHALGEFGPARRHWREAATGYAELGVPEAEEVRAELAAADGRDAVGQPLA